jgi:FtsH-binding integral membrane protein
MTRTKVALINLAVIALMIGSAFVAPRAMALTHFLFAWSCVFMGLNLGLFARRRAERGKPGYQPGANLYIALALAILATVFPDLVAAGNRQIANQHSTANGTKASAQSTH